MGEQPTIGSLVSFVTVDGRIDTIDPVGLREKKLTLRLTHGENLYHPEPGEMGLILAGPEWPEEGNGIRLWEVLVGGKKWWFDEDHIMVNTKF